MEVGWTMTWRNRIAPSQLSSMKIIFAYLGVNIIYHYAFTYCKSLYFQYIIQKFLCLTYLREKKTLGVYGSVTESICQTSPYLYFSHPAIRKTSISLVGKMP